MPRTAQGRALLDAGRPLDAVEELRHGVAEGEPGAADLLARAYLESHSWTAAAAWLGPLVEGGHVRFAGAWGTALLALGHDDAAEAALRLAVRCGDVGAADELGILLRDQRRPAEALRVLEHAAREGDAQAPANIVELLLEAGDVEGAVAHAERWADEQRPDTLVALGDARSGADHVEEAERAYRRAAELGAQHGHSAYAMFLLRRWDDEDEAARELDAARAADEPGWATSTARFLLETGRPDDARAYLRLALDSEDRGAIELRDELDELDGTASDD